MKLETAKTLALIILIGISLLLTYGLWSYQPSGDTLQNPTYEAETSLGGTKESKKSLIEPESVIFHADNSYYGFSDPLKQRELYNEMQSWVLNNFETGPPKDILEQSHLVELVFPDELPMNILNSNSLFNFNDKETVFPSWHFNRVYFTFESETASLQAHFVSANGQQEATAYINDSANYEQLWSYVSNMDFEVLQEYMLFNEENTPIYIPANRIELPGYSFTIEKLDPNLLINALFRTPSAVRPIYNNGERLYTDNQRQIRVFENGSSMEFYNPYPEDYERTESLKLIDQSILSINDHFGWTQEYNLLDVEENTVRYLMYYDGYPVFDSSHLNLNIIEQRWINQDLSIYQRPLYTLETSFPIDSVELPSGSDIIHYLENNPASNYNIENITDLQIGYRLNFQGEDDSIILVPAWYMNYNGSWLEFKFSDLSISEGGS
ncbi:hypothetical protein CIL03_06955 [Virgibacillus indicus]|uniref:Regulatory protein YycH domain-containing protein n=1 Tax=Virgibacillus indicus TaxID=2024554 RepID=A0A265NBM4_9BACI|nr:two-component system activity regulator YycH [Virgibacillus indicus]OZU89442.1 hypothetical protein CIL03_06955 [Virgibacillus indicus]